MTQGVDFEAPPPEDSGERLSPSVVEAVAPRARAVVCAPTYRTAFRQNMPAPRNVRRPPRASHGYMARGLGVKSPGLVFARPRPAPVDKSRRRRKTVSQGKNDAAQFHDNDSSEDVYDLYNACNGIMINGLLDINRLDELSPAEKEEFDKAKLREVWEHTATGCEQCAAIIDILNRFRDRARESMQCRAEGQHEPADVNVDDPIS
jgi:hypothetical protein